MSILQNVRKCSVYADNRKLDTKFHLNFGAINKIGWRARTYAVAAMLLFAGKVGGTSALKAKYPILRPFLP